MVGKARRRYQNEESVRGRAYSGFRIPVTSPCENLNARQELARNLMKCRKLAKNERSCRPGSGGGLTFVSALQLHYENFRQLCKHFWLNQGRWMIGLKSNPGQRSEIKNQCFINNTRKRVFAKNSKNTS